MADGEENSDSLPDIMKDQAANGSSSASKRSTGNDDEPMLFDPNLPTGWKRLLTQRKIGASAGKYDVYLFSPAGKKFRSRTELANFIDKEGMDLDADDFDFTVRGKDNYKKNTPAPKQRSHTPKRTPKATKNNKLAVKTSTGKRNSKRKITEDVESDSPNKKTKSTAAQKLVVKMPFSSSGKKGPKPNSEQTIAEVHAEESGARRGRISSENKESGEKLSSPPAKRQRRDPSKKKEAASPVKSLERKGGKKGKGKNLSSQKEKGNLQKEEGNPTPKKRGRPPKQKPPPDPEPEPEVEPEPEPEIELVEPEAPPEAPKEEPSQPQPELITPAPALAMQRQRRISKTPAKLRDISPPPQPKSSKKQAKKKTPTAPKKPATTSPKKAAPKQIPSPKPKQKRGRKPKAPKTEVPPSSPTNLQSPKSHRSPSISESNTQVLQDSLLVPLPELPEPFLSDSSNPENSGSESLQATEHSFGSSTSQGSALLTETYTVLTEEMQMQAGIVFMDHSYAAPCLTPTTAKPKVVHRRQRSECEPTLEPEPQEPKGKRGGGRKRTISEPSSRQAVIKLNRQDPIPEGSSEAPSIIYAVNPQMGGSSPVQILSTLKGSVSASVQGGRSLILPSMLTTLQEGDKSLTGHQPRVLTLPVNPGPGQSILTLAPTNRSTLTQPVITLAPGSTSLAGKSIITLSEGGTFTTAQPKVVTLPANARAPIAQNPNVITLPMGNRSPISPANITALQMITGSPSKGSRRISFSVGVPSNNGNSAPSTQPPKADTTACPSTSPKQRSA